MKLSLVIPVHNEEDNVVEAINKIESTLTLEYDLIVVNDHSTDSTLKLVEGLAHRYSNIMIIENSLPAGFANAVRTGLCNVKTEVVIPIMGDLCDDLNSISKMLVKINEGYDVVCGSRYIKGGVRLGGSRLKGFLSCLGGWSIYYLLRIPTHDIANAFKMYRKKVIDSIDIKAKSFEISMELPLKAYFKGFKITEVPTIWHERKKGKSNFKILKLLPNYLKLYLWAVLASLRR